MQLSKGGEIGEVQTRSKVQKAKSLLDKRKYLMAGVLVVLFAIIILAVFLSTYKKDNNVTAVKSDVCADLYPRIDKALKPINLNDLKTLSDEIQKRKDFDKDPDCLYPLVIYNVSSSHADQAQSYLDKLRGVYRSDVGFTKAYKHTYTDPDQLQQLLQFLKNTRFTS